MSGRSNDSESPSSSGSDEEFEIVVYGHPAEVEAYQFEPIAAGLAECNQERENFDEELQEPQAEAGGQPSRMQLPVRNWCKCEQCDIQLLVNEKEAFCREICNITKKTPGTS
jgi:hypothetical protein